ncbi:MAG: nicotinate (nicotinamide) nucleotide adenylyltransferase [Verrucomicrobiota bacterium]|nr:nicotinate (nicotinamide) nucleotide adenylyltransferase [Verrucomicrobiota bacterium]
MKKVGFFGGSFDPIHFGHLNLAIEILERCGLDEVLFCPAFCSPFKTEHPPVASGDHRLEMVRRAISAIRQFRVTPVEIERKGPSFTVETLRKLQTKGASYHLILAEDAALHFDRWKEPQQIIELAPLIVGTRGMSVAVPMAKTTVQIPLFDISSTEIRARLKKKLYCGHLIPAKALDYIQEHGLYS